LRLHYLPRNYKLAGHGLKMEAQALDRYPRKGPRLRSAKLGAHCTT